MDKSFLVLFFKKEQLQKALLFEKRSKNFYPLEGLHTVCVRGVDCVGAVGNAE